MNGRRGSLPRRPYYGWLIASTLALTETVSWGVLFYAFAVFLVPMRRELGWSTASLTGAYSLALLIAGLGAPFVGHWLDRHGPRLLMTAGSVLGSLLVVAWAIVDSLPAFYLVWAGIGLAMAATLYEPAFVTLASWFERERGRALLVVTVAAGFASTIFLPLSSRLVERVGWRPALLILAATLALLTIAPHALVLRRRPEDVGLHPDGVACFNPGAAAGHRSVSPSPPSSTPQAALRQATFWWLTIAFSLEAFSTVALGVHLIPYLTERGDGARFAATATGLIGAAQVGARLAVTALGGRFAATSVTAGVLALHAVAIAILIQWQSSAGVLTAVLLLGASRGAVTLMRATIVADFYGPAHYGAINGLMALVLTGARAAAPLAIGFAYVVVGGYRWLLWGLAGCALTGALAMVGSGRARRNVPRA